jgi:hypothetical protein
MMPSWKMWIALFVALTAAFICIHPDFDLQDGVLHKGFDIDGYAAFGPIARLDFLTTHSATSMIETSSAYAARTSDSLDLICVRLC